MAGGAGEHEPGGDRERPAPGLLRAQLVWKKRASCGLRALEFSKWKTCESIGASSLQAVQRNHAGNGVTGTPTLAAGPFGSWSMPSSHGAGSSSLHRSVPRAAALRRAAAGSTIGCGLGTAE